MTDTSVLPLEMAHKKLCHDALIRSFSWFGAIALAVISMFYLKDHSVMFQSLEIQYVHLLSVPLLALVSGALMALFKYMKNKSVLDDYGEMSSLLNQVQSESDMSAIKSAIANAKDKSHKNHLIKELFEIKLPILERRLGELSKYHLHLQLKQEIADFSKNCDRKLEIYKKEVPLFKAKKTIRASLKFLQKRRAELEREWDEAYEKFSWWNKIKHGGGPDFSEMDKVVKELKHMDRMLDIKHHNDFKRLNAYFSELRDKAVSRVNEARQTAEHFIQEHGHREGIDSDILKKSLWLSALSVPVSVWIDVDNAGDVFDALRRAHDGFSGMSDAEIWWETVFLPSESLVGLAALTKGAYFEQLVAADTGGELFEHFNNPDTDIVVDGVVYQIKATGSETYVNNVADSIPVIATSEVALPAGAIDSGYTNEELANTVDLALGSTVVDVGDTTVDAVLAGAGGLGLFATLQGLNHAVEKHKNGSDGVEAAFEGAGIAIEGTARAMVGAAEMGYNVLASRPSRFVGRTVLKGFEKLDAKMMGESDRK